MIDVRQLENMEEPMDIERMFGNRLNLLQSHRSTEKVIYYRTPQLTIHGLPHPQAGWIQWGDSQASKLEVQLYFGFIPLYKYGRIWDEPNTIEGDLFRAHGPWGSILSHPDGPAELPVDQILAYHWYRPEYLPAGLGHIRFPQLSGMKIREYRCPECMGRAPFLKAVHLARHLRLIHDYDRAEVIAYGTTINVDFARSPDGGGVVDFIYGDSGTRTVTASAAAPFVPLGYDVEEITPEHPDVAEPAPKRTRAAPKPKRRARVKVKK